MAVIKSLLLLCLIAFDNYPIAMVIKNNLGKTSSIHGC
jgi:hypothetical protein